MCIAGQNEKGQPLQKSVWWFLKEQNKTKQNKTKQNIELPYDPEILLLVEYPKELKARTRTDVSVAVFNCS